MKVSEWLRRYQISGVPPEDCDDTTLSFWCGWLMGGRPLVVESDRVGMVEMAIKAAEFIEERAK